VEALPIAHNGARKLIMNAYPLGHPVTATVRSKKVEMAERKLRLTILEVAESICSAIFEFLGSCGWNSNDDDKA
jgi:hypothetical protein